MRGPRLIGCAVRADGAWVCVCVYIYIYIYIYTYIHVYMSTYFIYVYIYIYIISSTLYDVVYCTMLYHVTGCAVRADGARGSLRRIRAFQGGRGRT